MTYLPRDGFCAKRCHHTFGLAGQLLFNTLMCIKKDHHALSNKALTYEE